MLTGKKIIIIADISTIHDEETGDIRKEVTHGSKIGANIDLVGINTAQLGQAQGFTLAYSVEVPRYLYHAEKYVYCEGELFTVATPSKAKSPVNMLLNIQELDDKDILEAIEAWKALH